MSAYKLKGLGLSSLMVMILTTHAAAKEESISRDAIVENVETTADERSPASKVSAESLVKEGKAAETNEDERSRNLVAEVTETPSAVTASVEPSEAALDQKIKADIEKAATIKGNLQNALVKGVGYSYGFSSSQSGVQSAAEAVAKTTSLWLPTISLDTSASTTFNQIKQPNRVSMVKQQINDAKAGLTLKQNIYSGGATLAQIASAEAGFKVAESTFTQKEIQTLLNSAIAYLDVVRDRKLVEIAKKNMENLEKQVEAAKIRYEVGEDTITAVVASESYFEEARAKKIEAEANLAASETNYISLTGELPSATMEAPELPLHLLPATLDEAIKIAMKNNPDIKIQTARYKSAEADVDSAASSLLPTLDLQVTGTRDIRSTTYRNYPGPYAKTNTNDATALIQLSMPLDFRGANQAAVREKKQAAVAQRLTIADTQNSVLGKVNGSWAQLQSYSARIAARKKQVETSGFAVKQVQEEFKVGNKSYTDVLVAEGKDYEARTALVLAERDQIAIAYQLLSIMGTLTIKEMNLGIPSVDTAHLKYQAMDNLWGIDIEEAGPVRRGEDLETIKLTEIDQKRNAEDYKYA